MRARCKYFYSADRDKACNQAAEFVTRVGPNRLITVSCAPEEPWVYIYVWYWEQEEGKPAEAVG